MFIKLFFWRRVVGFRTTLGIKEVFRIPSRREEEKFGKIALATSNDCGGEQFFIPRSSPADYFILANTDCAAVIKG
jgi:hypothetical protein